MSGEISVWNKVLGAAMAMPGLKVNRDTFLRKELTGNCTPEQMENALAGNPISCIPIDVIDKIANACINNHTTKVTTLSAISGIPGGILMAGTIPADIAQYYWHVFVLSQKLAYLYGFPNLWDKEGNLTEKASDLLTLFVGVMMGVSKANQGIKIIAQALKKEVTKRVPRMALTKTLLYPIIKQVAKWIGIKLTKQSFGRVLGKAVPLLGGIVSGVLTYSTFRPCAKRLQRRLKEEMCQ